MVNVVRRRLKAGFWILVFLVGVSGGTAAKLSPVAVASAAGTGSAQALRSLNADRIVFLAQLAEDLASVDPERAAWLLERVFQKAQVLDDTGPPWFLGSLKEKDGSDADSDREELDPETAWAMALEEVARVYSQADPANAANPLHLASAAARRLADPETRDHAYRKLAPIALRVEPELAQSLADAIQDRSVRAWAYLSLAEAGPGKGPLREADWGRCFDASLSVPDLYQRALVLAGAARSVLPRSADWARRFLKEAVKTAVEIPVSDLMAEALGEIGSVWGRLEPDKAFELAAMIPDTASWPKIRIFLEAAETAADGPTRRRLLEAGEKAWTAGPESSPRWGAAVAGAWADLEPETGEAFLARHPDVESGYGDEIRARTARTLWVMDFGRAARVVESIQDPDRRIETMAEMIQGSGEERSTLAARLLQKLEPDPASVTDDRLRSLLGRGWASVSEEKALFWASLVEEPVYRARTFAQVAALSLRRSRDGASQTAWIKAVAAAAGVGPAGGLERAEAYRDIARILMQYAPDQAVEAFRTACQEAAGTSDFDLCGEWTQADPSSSEKEDPAPPVKAKTKKK